MRQFNHTSRTLQLIAAKLRSTNRLLTLSLLLSAVAIIGIAVGLRATNAQSGGSSPDYSKVGNALAGTTHIMRQDDLVLTTGSYNGDPTPDTFRTTLSSLSTSNSSGKQIFDNSVVPAEHCGGTPCLYGAWYYTLDTPIVTGRFFRTTADSVVTYPALRGPNPEVVTLTGRLNSANAPFPASYQWNTAQPLPYGNNATTISQGLAADFNQDGYDDLLMTYSDYTGAFDGNPRVRIATANDLNDPSKGFNFGSEQSLGFYEGIRSTAIGDFNGDGQPDIAVLRVTSDKGLYVDTYAVNPQTLAVSYKGEALVETLASTSQTYNQMQLVAGSFTASRHQQLVIANQSGATQAIKLRVFDFAQGSYTPVVKQTWDSQKLATNMKMLTSKFAWDSPYDVLSLMVTNADVTERSPAVNPTSFVFLITVDPGTLEMKVHDDVDVNATYDIGYSRAVALDIAVGNFNNIQPDPADPSKTQPDPNLQLAVAVAYPNGSRTHNRADFNPGKVGIIQVIDQSTGKMSLSTAGAIPYLHNANYLMQKVTINTADLQSRSLRLGGGYKITVDRAAPTTILAAPPMHADYVTPNGGLKPTVLNLSVVPDAFKSSYEQESSADASTTTTTTVSSTFSGEESIGGSYTLGQFDKSGDLENGFKISDTFKAKQDIENSTETKNGTFQSTEFSIEQETGLSDVVWFKDSSYYLYVYEVIGQTVCKDGTTDSNGKCADSDRVPMRLMFSAPKEASVQRLASDTLEWYQPPWEYGNLLSYPSSLAQLKQYIPDIALLTQESSGFATDDSATTFKTVWTTGKKDGQTVSHKQLFTEDNDLSVEGSYSLTILGSLGSKTTGSLDLDFGGSNGTESLQESEATTKSSTGITVTKKAVFPNSLAYKYFFNPYIFGKQEPLGFTDPVNSDSDLITFGALRSAFTANPLPSGAGGWWKQTYTAAPDVALNHPNRWEYTSNSKPPTIPINCVGIDTFTMGCVKPADRAPENPWLSNFHDMRGFFITDARSPGEGPQKQLATVGDKLSLQTRVYNYSLATMPAGTQVKVRFYGMEWDTAINRPADPEGSSFLIGENTLSPIAPFSDGANAPLNWVTAGTTFDTTGHDGQDLVFWVAVWMQDANGNLVGELPGKGLTKVPEAGDYAKFSVFTELEPMVANPVKTDPSEPDTVSFSNNIGFYRLPFYVQTKAEAAALRATRATAGSGIEQVKVEHITAESASIKLGKSEKIHVLLQNGAEAVQGVTVYFYDGDPAQGGKLFDAERLAHIRPNAKQKVSVVYNPQQCGAHQIFVKVTQAGDVGATGKAAQPFQVECETPVCATQACLKAAQYYALNLNSLPRGQVTITGISPMNQVSTSDVGRLRILLQGGQTASQKFNQQFVALQLNLLGTNDPTRQAEKSNLLCYRAIFQPVQLSTGVTLSPSTIIGELLNQARTAARGGNAIDQRTLANVMQLLGGDDPSGRCK